MTGGQAFIRSLIADQARAQRSPLALAALAAAGVSIAAAALLGVSGWFLTGAALAGLAGPIAAISFNFLLPSAVIRLLAIVRTALRYGERLSGHHAALEALAAIRAPLFARMAAGSPDRLFGFASGEAASRLGQDVDALQTAFVRRSAVWAAGGAIVAGVGLAALAGWVQAVIAGLAVVAQLFVARLLGRVLAERQGAQVQVELGALKSDLSMLEQGAPELVAYGAAPLALDALRGRGEALHSAQGRLAGAGGWMLAAQFAIMGLAVSGLLLTSLGGDAPLVALAVLGTVAAVEGAGAFAEAARLKGAAEAAIERLGELAEPHEPWAREIDPEAELGLKRLAEPLLAGGRLAVTGPSGCGKTSLIERLMALRSPRPGEWRVGETDVCEADAAGLRGLFAYAPQASRFIEGTVRQNLRLADLTATDAELLRALEDACLADRFAQAGGLDAWLAEDARILSGGERRRLILARAYVRRAPWLVLDEPTEGLDAEIEERVLRNLDDRLRATGQGLILVSHRPAPIGITERHLRLGDAAD